MTKRPGSAIADARKALETRITFEAFIAKLGARDRVNLERHVAACELEPAVGHAALWTRMVSALVTLSPLAAQTTGQRAVTFFVADGKYRLQMFAIEDNRDGKLLIYVDDVLDEAFAAGVLEKKGAVNEVYKLVSDPDQTLFVEQLTAANSPNPAPFFKHMLGWNRKALRINLPVDASNEMAEAAENICALAVLKRGPIAAAPQKTA